MTTTQPRARHNMLFELLRQKHLSEETTKRVEDQKPQVSRGDALLLQSLAASSFREQRLPRASRV
ncbi:hypothetical protein [Ruegeria jejuensis]|uniref:hypothetical protein n=1 Tax=Ruegeria jejuensis TaxID=3233338 RepID=UPI00355C34E8